MRKKLQEVHGATSQVDSQLIEQLKVTSFQELYELLQEYQSTK